MNDCWMLSERPCFILLGRYGDLIQMLPCFRAVAERTGQKPVVIVSSAYAGLFDGITYAYPYVITDNWFRGIPKARDIARNISGQCTFVRWWLDDPQHTRMLEEATSGDLVLQCHGHNWGVDIKKWPDYGTSMASRCGFTREEWLSLPLVFDRRHPQREKELARMMIGQTKQPVLLFNFKGVSSPFAFTPEIQLALARAFPGVFRMIDLGKLIVTRIFDLLGLYERAAGLITIDTATLHLAAATSTPYVAFTVDGWSSSVPKGNCILEVKYSQARQRIPDILNAVARFQKT